MMEVAAPCPLAQQTAARLVRGGVHGAAGGLLRVLGLAQEGLLHFVRLSRRLSSRHHAQQDAVASSPQKEAPRKRSR